MHRACAPRVSGLFDVARVHVSLSELVLDDADPEPPRVINATVQSEYARLAGISPAALTEAMQPYLPILRASSGSVANLFALPCHTYDPGG